MASIERKENGSVKIVVSCGYDSKGKKLRESLTIQPEDLVGLTSRQKEKEIERRKVLFEQQVRNGTYMDGEKISFAEFTEKWLSDYAEKHLAPKTYYEYTRLLKNRITPAIGHIKLAKLQPHQLIEFYNNLEENGMRLDSKHFLSSAYIEKVGTERLALREIVSNYTIQNLLKGNTTTRQIAEKISQYFGVSLSVAFELADTNQRLSGNTINHCHKLISTILTSAVQWQIIAANPCDRVKPPKIEHKEAKHYDDADATKMFSLLESAPLKYQAGIYIAIFGGLRLGEVTALEWEDIDFDKRTITINKAAQYVPGTGNFEKDPKSVKSRREIVLPVIVFEKLSKHRAAQATDRLAMGNLWKGDKNKVFAQANGKVMFHDTISKWFNKWLAKNDLPHIRFHELRHTSASLLIAQGVDIATVSRRLGHSNISTTANIYTHALQKMDHDAADRIGNLFKTSTP